MFKIDTYINSEYFSNDFGIYEKQIILNIIDYYCSSKKEYDIFVNEANKINSIAVLNNNKIHFFGNIDDLIFFISNCLEEKITYRFSFVDENTALFLSNRYTLLWCDEYWGFGLNDNKIKELSLNCRSLTQNDLSRVVKHYNFDNNTKASYLKEMIEYNVTSAIDIDGKLVSWVLRHYDGSIGAIYTIREYRNRGCALEITKDIINKICSLNQIPMLTIRYDNTISQNLAIKNGFNFIKKYYWLEMKK